MDGAAAPGASAQARERRLGDLVLDELRRAAPLRLGIELPQDKRLRALCEAVLADPSRHATLDGWAEESAASTRTVARLFRQRARHVLRAVAAAGAAGACADAGRQGPADGADRQRAGLRQPQCIYRHGAARRRPAAEPLLFQCALKDEDSHMSAVLYDFTKQDASGASCVAQAWAKAPAPLSPAQRQEHIARAKALLKAARCRAGGALLRRRRPAGLGAGERRLRCRFAGNGPLRPRPSGTDAGGGGRAFHGRKRRRSCRRTSVC